MCDWINSKNGGVILRIKVIPNSSKNQFSLLAEYLKINIMSPAIENRANQELIRYLSKTLNLKKNEIQIIKGEKGKIKQIFIPNNNKENIIKLVNEVINEKS